MASKTKPQTWDPDWQTKYKDRVVSAEEAIRAIRPGQRIFVGTGCGQPEELVRALTARGPELPDTEIVHLLTSGDAPYADHKFSEYFRVNSFFISENVRGIIQEGLGDYTPVFLSDIPTLFNSGQIPLDAALIEVTPPDEKGRCSLGVSVDIVKSAADNARLVIAEVNPQMPRTLGDAFIDIHDIDFLVPVDEPVIEVQPQEPDEITLRIGRYVAALVDNGATVEFGIGKIPQAVVPFLKDRKDLGIHTEMFTDSMIDLIESGAVTGARKTTDRSKIVASFCMGTKRLYDYIDNNPLFAFHPTEYVNDPFLISRQHRQVAINVAMEIDLTGQVCADSIGNRFYSGIGGQVDFNRGAGRSPGGRAIIALPSTAKGGTISRIVTQLSPGAGVVTTRGDVHYVVTEHGVAYLHGKSVQARALALIAIADPQFRPQLVREAIEAKYLRPEMAGVEGKIIVGPQEFRTTCLLRDGTQVMFRPIHPTDEPNVRDMFYALSEETKYYRFMKHIKTIPQQQIQDFVFINHRSDIAIVATVPAPYGEEIVAIGRYYLNEKTNLAEVAFIVHDRWQNRGIGTFLLNHLATIAKRYGIRGFTAEVLRANRPMQRVFTHSHYKVTSEPQEDVIHFHIEFS
jgi:acyl-CoA hydrolase/GNAT superfamily N-acetyltransferase